MCSRLTFNTFKCLLRSKITEEEEEEKEVEEPSTSDLNPSPCHPDTEKY